MVNCLVTITKDVEVLDHGHKAATQSTSTVIYAGPAYLAAPTRSWEREAAFEGTITGELHVHTTAGMQGATKVVIARHGNQGEYQVLAVAATSSEWRLALGRRP